jgi:hypothetical protein
LIVRAPTPVFFAARRGMGSTGNFSAVANAIQQQEGYYPGSVAYANNNPGNLMYAGQPGATQGPNGFAVFPDYQTGYQALLNQISLDASRGETISQFISKYAPASAGNPTQAYAQNVAAAVGLSPNDLLSAAATGTTPLTPTDTAVTDTTGDSSPSSPFDVLSASVLGGGDPTPLYLVLGLAGGILAWALFRR